MLYLACLYHQYEDGPRFVILTQPANGSVADVHQRMPVIVPQKKIPAWLNETDFAGRLIRMPGPELIKIAQ
jgi:putative SOS response-associated peptidase YedK